MFSGNASNTIVQPDPINEDSAPIKQSIYPQNSGGKSKIQRNLIISVIILIFVAVIGITSIVIVIVLKFGNIQQKTTEVNNVDTTTRDSSVLTKIGKSMCAKGFVEPHCEECGLHIILPNLKIVGGQEAEPHSWPSIVWIKFNYKFSVTFNNQIYNYDYGTSCGGTLLNRDTVLTAAHCIVTHALYSFAGKLIEYEVKPNKYYDTYESMFTVYLGMHSKSNTSKVIVANVSKVFRHPSYDEMNTLNDIAILKLKNEIELNSFIQPACLPIIDNYPTQNNINAWAAGWGKLEFNGVSPESLQNVKLKIYDSSKCSLVGIYSRKDWRKQICAGEYSGGKDTCQGDSGGPLFVQDMINGKVKFIIAGITSYGIGCGDPNYPGYFLN